MRVEKTTTDRHWDRRAREENDDARVNIADTVQRDLESAFVFAHLAPEARILEVGCGNGYLTAQLRDRVTFVDAFDFSESMVARARERHGETNNRFFQDNVLAPSRVAPPYDTIVCVRVLINLANLEEQRTALANMASWLEPGGRLILVEGFADGFAALNDVRVRSGIAPMHPAPINFYSGLDALMPDIERHFAIGERFHSGMFDFLTRVVYPALVGAEAATGPSDFHARIAPIASAFNPDAMRDLARLHGFVLTRR